MPCGELDGSLAPETPPSQISADGSTALATVDTTDEDTSVVVDDVATLRALLPDPGGDGLRAYVTGEAGFTADASEAFEGIDETLLAITLVLVLVLLLATYRSPRRGAGAAGRRRRRVPDRGGGVYGLVRGRRPSASRARRRRS